MAGVDIVDVQMRRLGVGFAGAGAGWKGILAWRAKAGIVFPPSPMRRLPGVTIPASAALTEALSTWRDRVESRALPVAGDEDGNGVLMKARMSSRSAAVAKPCAAGRTNGP